MRMKQIRFYLFLFFLISFGENVFATHNRAGEITYEWIGTAPNDYKYRITIITYTKRSSVNVDRPRLDSVYLGDNLNPTVFIRSQQIQIPNEDINKNVYVKEHTYSGNGRFLIYFIDPNRNEGVVNIPNSVDVPFEVQSLLIINPYLGNNSSPVLTYPPIDKGCVNRIFIHNPGAFDPDGDSLAYELVQCNVALNTPVPGYSFPNASNSFALNPITGDLVWDSPVTPGEYNVAFHINQYKKGQFAGYVRRDMQILIGECTNNPPFIEVVSDTCVLAGDTLRFDMTAIDPDRNLVEISAFGAVFDSALVGGDPAIFFRTTVPNNDTVVGRFEWAAKCHHVRSSPYTVQFKARDVQPVDSIALVALKTTTIRVIAPGPATVTAIANGNAIDLSWSMSPCSEAIGYHIYRRTNSYPGTIECPCDNGAPSYTGYQLLETLNSIDSVNFSDSNNGQGLAIGVEYCYIITAFFADGSESCASPQTCATLKKDLPVLTHADVTSTDALTGTVYVDWSKPTELDTIQFPGPYEYRVFHSPDFFGNNFTQFAVLNDLNDTIIVDSNINTAAGPWSYKVDLYYNNSGVPTLKGSSTNASTIFLSISPTDNRLNLTWEEFVPWTNTSYDVFRLNNTTLLYDSIATVSVQQFSDTGLANGTQYCYYIRSSGSYSRDGIPSPLYNKSQQLCSVPVDNVHPCATDLEIISDCINNANMLTWVNPNLVCSDDVLKYYIYYSPVDSLNFERIDSILDPNVTSYLHYDLEIISGCYKVTGVDSVGNETLNAIAVCIDTCREYVLPSVFTPNGDGMNDIYHPCDSTTDEQLQSTTCPPYKNVKEIDMKIYNRWGKIVYETKDKDVLWDGKDMESKADCVSGVYFYTCKVYFYRIFGEDVQELHGTIQLIRNN